MTRCCVFSFSPCGNYEPQQWGWPRQDVGYPYYSESPLQPLSHQNLPLPPPDSSSAVGSCGTGICSTSSTDCRIGTSQLGGAGGRGGGYEGDPGGGRQSVKDEPADQSNDRLVNDCIYEHSESINTIKWLIKRSFTWINAIMS